VTNTKASGQELLMKQTQSAHRLSLPKWIVGFLITANLIGSAFAQSVASNFPNKPVRIIVPQTPGGASDALARIVGQKLSEKWGQPVVIENRPGAGGNIGMDAVAKAPGDGHTLLMSYVGSHAINPSIYSKLPFDPEADFVAVATLANVPFVAAVNASVPVANMKALATYAGQKPVAFGSAGNGSVNKRSAAFKDIPTIAESGFPGFVINPWFGLFASKGTPASIARQINADIKKVMEDKDVQDRFAAVGAEPFETTPQEFQAILNADIKTWAAVVKSSGATAD